MTVFNNRYVVTKAEGVGGRHVPPDEPCLVIRAQDVLAVSTLARYIGEYGKLPEPDPAVLRDLGRHMVAIIEWQSRNKHAVKVADR